MKSQGMAVIGIVLVAFIVLSGCVECQKDADCEDKQICIEGKCSEYKTKINVFVGGDKAIVGSFIYPEELYKDQGFEMTMGFDNKGEESIEAEALEVYLGGVDWTTYNVKDADSRYGFFKKSGVIKGTNTEAIAGVEKSVDGKATEGGYSEFDFNTIGAGKIELKANEPAGVPVTFVATMCYPYKTRAAAQACIGKPVSGEVGMCDPNSDNMDISVSGAPVKITKITEKTSGQTNIFRIYFENVGLGEPYTKELGGTDTSNCVTGLTAPDKGKIKIESIKLGDEEIATQDGCKLQNTEKSVSTGMITCQYDNKGASLAKRTMFVNLSYSYVEKVDKEITVLAA